MNKNVEKMMKDRTTWNDVLREAEIRDALGKRVEELKPLFKDAIWAQAKYDEQPNIKNGALMHETKKALHAAIYRLAQDAIEKWHLDSEVFERVMKGLDFNVEEE